MIDELTRTKPTTAPPPKLWHNWFRSLVNDQWSSGERGPFVSPKGWPTRDIAETKAEAWESWSNWRGKVEYLGAFPDGEAP